MALPTVIPAITQILAFMLNLGKWVVILKGILITLCITVVPIVLNNFVYDMIEILQEFLVEQFGSETAEAATIEIVGVGAWGLNCLRIPEIMSFMISVYIARRILSIKTFGIF